MHRRSVQCEYRDQFGVPHTRRVVASEDVWEKLQEGGPLEVIYSQRRPKVSAPKYLMDVVKTAKATIRIDARE
jgi:hypothetical protein